MASTNEEFRDWLLRNAHEQHRFENGVVRAVGSNYDLARLRIHDQISRLEQYGTGFTREWRLQRLQSTMDSINATMGTATENATSTLTRNLDAFSTVQAEAIHGRLGDIASRVGIAMNRLPAEQVAEMVGGEMLGETYQRRLIWQNADAVRTIRSRLTQAIITGEDMRTARNYLLGRGVGMGGKVGEITKSHAEMIARTEIQRVSNAVSRGIYDRNQDILKGIQYTATLDRRTCIVCASRDGKAYYYASNIASAPIIPIHPHCRCLYSPVTKSWKELGAPKALAKEMDGRIPSALTYDQWLRTQSTEFAQKFLGPTRYGPWRSGRLKLTEMVKGNRVISTRTLRRRFAGVPEWKPVMTRAEAALWARGSVVKETVYHATLTKNIPTIHSKGLDPIRGSPSAWLGQGNYFVVGEKGRRYFEKLPFNMGVVEARVKVLNPYRAMTPEQVTRLKENADAWVKTQGLTNLKAGQRVTKYLKSGNYDGVLATEFGHPIVVTFDKMQSIVILPAS